MTTPCSSCNTGHEKVVVCTKCNCHVCLECALIFNPPSRLRWQCSKCTSGGIVGYDEGRLTELAGLKNVIFKRLGATTPMKAEIDAYSQMVYDARVGCAWQVFGEHSRHVVEIAEREMKEGRIPCISPFEAIYFPHGPGFWKRLCHAHLSDSLIERGECFKSEAANWTGTGKFKIGFVSSDLRGDHPVGDLMMSAFHHFDGSRFELYFYYLGLASDQDDEYANKLRLLGTLRCFPYRWKARKIAEDIAKDGVHLLLNLNGHTSGNRNEVFELRPAPVQVGFLGFAGPMGGDSYNFTVADRQVVSRDSARFTPERIAWMPRTYMPTSHRELYASCKPSCGRRRSEVMMSRGYHFIFCNFGQLSRITESMFRSWVHILKEASDAILWLPAGATEAQQRLRIAAEEMGLKECRQRIIFQPRMKTKSEHLERLTRADLYLDTRSYNSHTSGTDALWAGVPVLTLEDQEWPGRVGRSLLHAVGLGQSGLVTTSLREYRNRAIQLARNSSAMLEIRDQLLASRDSCDLFNARGWTRSFELLCIEMYRRRHANSNVLELTPEIVHSCYTLNRDTDWTKTGLYPEGPITVELKPQQDEKQEKLQDSRRAPNWAKPATTQPATIARMHNAGKRAAEGDRLTFARCGKRRRAEAPASKPRCRSVPVRNKMTRNCPPR